MVRRRVILGLTNSVGYGKLVADQKFSSWRVHGEARTEIRGTGIHTGQDN